MSKLISTREIHINDQGKNKLSQYTTNQVHTTKYTPLNFLVYFLLHELSRPANIFFCLIILIQVLILQNAAIT